VTRNGRQDGEGSAATRRTADDIAKPCSTDIGNEVAFVGVQNPGGMGFIEEPAPAQHYRHARHHAADL